MVDFTKVEGLTPEQQAAVSSIFDSEVSGLKSKVEELLGEKKAGTTKAAELEQIALDARKVAESETEARMKSANDMEGLKKLYEKQRADDAALYNAEVTKSKGALESVYRERSLNQVLSLVHDDYKDLSKASLERLIHLEYDESGAAKTVYKDGDKVIGNSFEEFKSWASEQPTWQKVLNGVNSSGAGVTKSNGGAMQGNTTESALNARLRASGIIN
tara:strand:+ start:432 stop:1082 length:651 start_codon:yes stop_codon:yes gene_type:complete